MIEIQLIEGVLKRAAQRRRVERAWRGFWRGLFIGAVLWVVAFGVFKLAPIPRDSLLVVAICAALVPLALALYAGFRPVSFQETARWVDSRKQLQERLS